jgi:hypothetical protein
MVLHRKSQSLTLKVTTVFTTANQNEHDKTAVIMSVSLKEVSQHHLHHEWQ